MEAERRAGILLKAMAEAQTRAAPVRLNGRDASGNVRKSSPTTVEAPKLTDLGISRDQSSKWQQLARMAEDDPAKIRMPS
jgi:hypothetical protein